MASAPHPPGPAAPQPHLGSPPTARTATSCMDAPHPRPVNPALAPTTAARPPAAQALCSQGTVRTPVPPRPSSRALPPAHDHPIPQTPGFTPRPIPPDRPGQEGGRGYTRPFPGADACREAVETPGEKAHRGQAAVPCPGLAGPRPPQEAKAQRQDGRAFCDLIQRPNTRFPLGPGPEAGSRCECTGPRRPRATLPLERSPPSRAPGSQATRPPAAASGGGATGLGTRPPREALSARPPSPGPNPPKSLRGAARLLRLPRPV